MVVLFRNVAYRADQVVCFQLNTLYTYRHKCQVLVNCFSLSFFRQDGSDRLMRQVSGCCTAVFSLHFASEDSLCHQSGLPLGTFFSLCHTRKHTHPVEGN